MNKKSWEREESPRVGLRLRLGGDKMVLSTPKGAILLFSHDQHCSINCTSLYMVNVMKKDSIYPPNARISSLLSIPSLLSIKTKLKHHIDYTHIKN